MSNATWIYELKTLHWYRFCKKTKEVFARCSISDCFFFTEPRKIVYFGTGTVDEQLSMPHKQSVKNRNFETMIHPIVKGSEAYCRQVVKTFGNLQDNLVL